MEAQDKHILGISALVIILVIGLMFTCGGLWNDNVKLKKQLSEAQNKPAQIVTNTVTVPSECPAPHEPDVIIKHDVVYRDAQCPVISCPSLPETSRTDVLTHIEPALPATPSEPLSPVLNADECLKNLVTGSCNLYADGCAP